MRWYVSQQGKTTGPFDEERIAILLQWGKISRGAFICDDAGSAWIPIRRSAFAPLLPPEPERPPRGALRDRLRTWAQQFERARPARPADPELGVKRALGLLAFCAVVGALIAAI